MGRIIGVSASPDGWPCKRRNNGATRCLPLGLVLLWWPRGDYEILGPAVAESFARTD